jgi:hypothetical protein
MLSKHEEQAERREVIENDKALRGASSQGSTFHQFGNSDAATPLGRFSAISSPHVVGSEPIAKYPQGPAWCAGDQGLEPPFPLDVNALEPVGQPHELKASIAELSAGPGSLQSQAPTSSVVPLAEPGDLTVPPAQSGRRFSSRTYRRV